MDTTVQDSKRNLMWCDIFGLDYCLWTKQKKRKMKDIYAKERGLEVKEVTRPGYDEVELDCCKTACPSPVKKQPKTKSRDYVDYLESQAFIDWYDERIKKENAMNCSAMSINAPAPMTEANVDMSKREHLSYRLNTIYYAKTAAAEVKFGLVDSSAPKTPKELVERVKAGLFVFTRPDKSDDEETWEYNNPWRGLRWRDPSLTEDRAGYSAVRDALLAEKTKLNDSLMIKDPLEALAELQAWEAA